MRLIGKTGNKVVMMEGSFRYPEEFINYLNNYLDDHKDYMLSGNVATVGAIPDLYLIATLVKKD